MLKSLRPQRDHEATPKLIRRIIKHLDKLSTDQESLQKLDDFYQHSRNFTFSRKAFPPPPNPRELPHIIEKYVQNITTTQYAGKIFHSTGPDKTTAALHTLISQQALGPAATDMAIAYFARIGDPVTILELLTPIRPQLHHFNHWLYSLYSQRRFLPDEFHLKGAMPILAAMRDEGIASNGQTWNMALLAMPSHHGLEAVYAEMQERQIPLDKDATSVYTKYLISSRGISQVIKNLEQEKMSRQVLHAVVEALLKSASQDNSNIRQAFDFMNFWASRGIRPTKSTLNIFLYQFSKRRHLDWMIGIAEFFESEYHVQMTSKSWEHMAYAVSRLNDSPRKYQMVGMIFKEAMKLSLTERAKNSFRLAYRFAEKNGHKILYPGQHVYPYLRDQLNWFRWSGPPDYSKDSEAAKAAGLLGFTSDVHEIVLHETEMEQVGINLKSLHGDSWNELLEDDPELH